MEKIEVLELDKKPKHKLKKWVKILLILFVIAIITIIGMIVTYNVLLGAVSSKSEVVKFTVDEGSSVYYVGEKLEKDGLIKNYTAFKIYVKLNNISELKAGTYKLDKNFKTSEIIKILSGNNALSELSITFKEGKTIRNVAKTIAKNTSITEEEVLSKMNDDTYIDTLINKYWFLTDDIKNNDIYYPLEGYLFPDTYLFNNNASLESVIEAMLDQSDKIFTKYRSLIDDSSYSINELVTLASIVESEGIYESDRKMIAGVFYNRLNSGMALGSDVTTYYACKVDLGERDLTSEELNTYNPYNTRGPKMEGKLPVGAISNFGESSLLAVLEPTNNDYYYFVADKSGKTHFTKTYQEHLQIISELKAANNWIEW